MCSVSLVTGVSLVILGKQQLGLLMLIWNYLLFLMATDHVVALLCWARMWRGLVSGQHEWWEVSLLTLKTPAWCFGWGRMLISGRVAISSVCPFQSAEENILLCSLHLSSVMKPCIGLVVPIYFMWALQGLIKCLCMCFERLIWKAMQNCYMLILPLIHIIVPWCAEFNHLGAHWIELVLVRWLNSTQV